MISSIIVSSLLFFIAIHAGDGFSDDNVTALVIDVGDKLARSLDISPLRKLVETEAASRMDTVGSSNKHAADKVHETFRSSVEL